MKKLEDKVIEITCFKDPEEKTGKVTQKIEAICLKYLAVHRNYSLEGDWILTHIKSGMRLSFFDYLGEAINCLYDLEDFIDWKRADEVKENGQGNLVFNKKEVAKIKNRIKQHQGE